MKSFLMNLLLTIANTPPPNHQALRNQPERFCI